MTVGNQASDLSRVQDKDVSLIGEIYNRRCLSLAMDEFDPAALSVVVTNQSVNATVVRFSGPKGTEPDNSLVRDFLNRVLELSVRAALQDSQT
jgi:hypothetical protein